ncbi:hypothetical protein [Halobacillus andaensis]|uniref:hypothetical protein n=1 Tax=Halobacillus andaensis TaxID=1176239 RepID=UPI003D70F70D
MIYAYLTPLVLLLCFFMAILFLFEWVAKLLLFLFLVLLTLLPFLVIYKEEVRDTEPTVQKENK